jgi:hypothetical protein
MASNALARMNLTTGDKRAVAEAMGAKNTKDLGKQITADARASGVAMNSKTVMHQGVGASEFIQHCVGIMTNNPGKSDEWFKEQVEAAKTFYINLTPADISKAAAMIAEFRAARRVAMSANKDMLREQYGKRLTA